MGGAVGLVEFQSRSTQERINDALLDFVSEKNDKAAKDPMVRIKWLATFLSPVPESGEFSDIPDDLVQPLQTIKKICDIDRYDGRSEEINDLVIQVQRSPLETYKILSATGNGGKIIDILKKAAADQAKQGLVMKKVKALVGGGGEVSTAAILEVDELLASYGFKDNGRMNTL